MSGSTNSPEVSGVRQLYNRVLDALEQTNLTDEQQQRVNDLLTAIHDGLDVTNDDTRFNTWLPQYLSRRHRQTPPERRERDLCGCGSLLCGPVRGRLPPDLRTVRNGLRSSRDAIRPQDVSEFLQRRPECHVLEDALNEWQAELSRTRKRLLAILSMLDGQVSAIPQGADPSNLPDSEQVIRSVEGREDAPAPHEGGDDAGTAGSADADPEAAAAGADPGGDPPASTDD